MSYKYKSTDVEDLYFSEFGFEEIKEIANGVLASKDIKSIIALSYKVGEYQLLRDFIESLDKEDEYLLDAFRFNSSESNWRSILSLDFARNNLEIAKQAFRESDIVRYGALNKEVLLELMNKHPECKQIAFDRAKSEELLIKSNLYNVILATKSEFAVENIKELTSLVSRSGVHKVGEDSYFEFLIEHMLDDKEFINNFFLEAAKPLFSTYEIKEEYVDKVLKRYPLLDKVLKYKSKYYPESLTSDEIEKLVDLLDINVIPYADKNQKLKMCNKILDDYYSINKADDLLKKLVEHGGNRLHNLILDRLERNYGDVRYHVAVHCSKKVVKRLINDPEMEVRVLALSKVMDDLNEIIEETDPQKDNESRLLLIYIAKLQDPSTFDSLIKKNFSHINKIIAEKCTQSQLLNMKNEKGEEERKIQLEYLKGENLTKYLDKIINKELIDLSRFEVLTLLSNDGLENEAIRIGVRSGEYLGEAFALRAALELGKEGIEYAYKFIDEGDEYYKSTIKSIESAHGLI